ncbi:MAG: radical SAM protein [Candidatus Kerfeldbacteria bacterium]|nr:radical SAM protein [Candidatus Kerfeldbacteria bacterium]
MKLPYLLNPVYRFARIVTPERFKPTVRGWYNMANKWATYGHTDIFNALDIEVNSRCNLKCSYCPVSMWDRGDQFMPVELFRKIIDDLTDFPFEYEGRVSPHFYGDPLLDDRLPELMAYVRAKLPKCSIIIHTNGIKLTREKYRQLVDAGITGFLITRHMAHWPKTVRDIVEFEPDAKKYIVRQTLDTVGLFDRGGTNPVKKRHHSRSCYYVSDEIAVDWRGRVVCTNDFFCRDSFGDVSTRSLKDIWFDPNFVNIRRQLRSGNLVLEHCRECLGAEKPTTHEKIPEGADIENYAHWKTPSAAESSQKRQQGA